MGRLASQPTQPIDLGKVEERETSADRKDNLAERLVMRRYATVLGWQLVVHKCDWRRSLAQGAYSYVAHPCLYGALREGRKSSGII